MNCAVISRVFEDVVSKVVLFKVLKLAPSWLPDAFWVYVKNPEETIDATPVVPVDLIVNPTFNMKWELVTDGIVNEPVVPNITLPLLIFICKVFPY